MKGFSEGALWFLGAASREGAGVREVGVSVGGRPPNGRCCFGAGRMLANNSEDGTILRLFWVDECQVFQLGMHTASGEGNVLTGFDFDTPGWTSGKLV